MPMRKSHLFAVVLIGFFIGWTSQAAALRLVTYVFDGESRIGAVVGETIIDLNRA
ncbi:MAG: hypothetical protein KatS3mg131_1646 [Candidatus Tectimicrobiota bacterium]|nr:MAG: hypothetical protein KatS3mg131_1646 [Candidatus Tectomicrobia bacterium]